MIKQINVTKGQIECWNETAWRDYHPIAVAIGSHLKNCDVSVFKNTITFERRSGEYLDIAVPPEVVPLNRKIIAFKGKPFSFDLFIPNELLKSTRRKRVK